MTMIDVSLLEWLALLALIAPFVGFVWAPKTWSPGELVTAALMNTNIRDHLNESLRIQTIALTGTQNNMALDGPLLYVRCTNASALGITGALIDSGNVAGAKVLFEAIDADVTFLHQNGSSTAANRFITPLATAFTLKTGQRALAIYDGTTLRWRVNRIVGDKASVSLLDIITGAAADSKFHFGEAADEGGWLTSRSDVEFAISMGAELVANAWTARATEAVILNLITTGIGFFFDDSLTDGNTFSPTQKMEMTTNGLNILSLFLQMDEIADASAPAANKARMYTRDTGGKTELVVRFNTGAIQQIAIEP